MIKYRSAAWWGVLIGGTLAFQWTLGTGVYWALAFGTSSVVKQAIYDWRRGR